MEVDVSRLDGGKERFEKLCSDLLIRVYPDLKPIDGSGGDDGVDSFVGMLNGSLVVFQYKFFVGRLDSSRKNQITDSLDTAKNKNLGMKVWTLLLPLNFTPEEQKWFESELKEKNPTVTIDYWGKQRLESETCKNDELLQRYFSASTMASAKIVQIALPLLTEAPVKRLISHAEEIKKIGDNNPHLGLTYIISPNKTSLTFDPKQPVEFSLVLKSPNKLADIKDHEGLMKRLNDGEIILGNDEIVGIRFKNKDFEGLSPDWKLSEVKLSRTEQAKRLIILEIPNSGFIFDKLWAEPRRKESVIELAICGLPFELIIIPEKDGKTISFNFSAILDDKPIFEIKRIIGVFDSFAKNGVIIRDNDGRPILSNGEIKGEIKDPFPQSLRELINRLYLIEQKTGTGFIFKRNISEKEFDAIFLISDLLSSGKHVGSFRDVRLTFKKEGLDSSHLLSGKLDDVSLNLEMFGAIILGKEVRVGDVRYVFPSLRVDNLKDVQNQLNSDCEDIKVVFQSDIEGDTVSVYLVKKWLPT